jgi:cell division transport system permease protein
MAKKIFQKHHYDIALESGVGANLVSWATGLMVFFMTLALAVNIGLASITDNWVASLSGSVTVELQPPMRAEDKEKIDEDEQKAFDEKTQKIAALGTNHPALTGGRVLDRAEVLKLIEPWLGSAMPADLPLPALIDLKLLPDADIEQLKKDILAIAPKATVDTHDDTLKDVSTLVNTARLFVLLLSGVIMLLAIFAISGMVRAKLAIHHQEVETLHLLGANDEYIARQFRHHTLKGTLKGAVLGVLAMLLTLFAIGHMTRTIDSSLLPSLDVLPMQWIVLLFSPILAGALIAHMTAQKTVMNALARLD